MLFSNNNNKSFLPSGRRFRPLSCSVGLSFVRWRRVRSKPMVAGVFLASLTSMVVIFAILPLLTLLAPDARDRLYYYDHYQSFYSSSLMWNARGAATADKNGSFPEHPHLHPPPPAAPLPPRQKKVPLPDTAAMIAAACSSVAVLCVAELLVHDDEHGDFLVSSSILIVAIQILFMMYVVYLSGQSVRDSSGDAVIAVLSGVTAGAMICLLVVGATWDLSRANSRRWTLTAGIVMVIIAASMELLPQGSQFWSAGYAASQSSLIAGSFFFLGIPSEASALLIGARYLSFHKQVQPIEEFDYYRIPFSVWRESEMILPSNSNNRPMMPPESLFSSNATVFDLGNLSASEQAWYDNETMAMAAAMVRNLASLKVPMFGEPLNSESKNNNNNTSVEIKVQEDEKHEGEATKNGSKEDSGGGGGSGGGGEGDNNGKVETEKTDSSDDILQQLNHHRQNYRHHRRHRHYFIAQEDKKSGEQQQQEQQEQQQQQQQQQQEQQQQPQQQQEQPQPSQQSAPHIHYHPHDFDPHMRNLHYRAVPCDKFKTLTTDGYNCFEPIDDEEEKKEEDYWYLLLLFCLHRVLGAALQLLITWAALSIGETVIVIFAEEKAIVTNPGERNGLHEAAIDGKTQLLRHMLESEAECGLKGVVNDVDSEGWTILHCAAYKGNSEMIQDIVGSYGDAAGFRVLNAQDHEGRTAFHLAVIEGHTECLETLATQVHLHGGKIKLAVNARDFFGRTALHMAAMRGHVAVIKMLLSGCLKEAGFSAESALDVDSRSAVHLAARRMRLAALRELLIGSGRDVEITPPNKADKFGQNILHLACRGVRVDMVNEIVFGFGKLAGFTAFNVVDRKGRTALHLAVDKGNVDICQQLLHPTSGFKALEKRDDYGWTALHIAARRGKRRISRLILNAGADPNSGVLGQPTYQDDFDCNTPSQ